MKLSEKYADAVIEGIEQRKEAFNESLKELCGFLKKSGIEGAVLHLKDPDNCQRDISFYDNSRRYVSIEITENI